MARLLRPDKSGLVMTEVEDSSPPQRRTQARFIFTGCDTGDKGVLNDVIGS